MQATSTLVNEVKRVVTEALGLGKRGETLSASTRLLENLPELDSLAVLKLVYAIEDRFGISIDDEEVTADLFETLGSLARFVESKHPLIARSAAE